MCGCAISLSKIFDQRKSRPTWKAVCFAKSRCSMTRQRIKTYGCRPVTTSKSCAAILKGSIRSASTNDGASSFNGMAAEPKQQMSIWTTIAICEVNHADDETQAGERRGNSDRRIYGADGPDPRRAGRSDGRAAQTRQ